MKRTREVECFKCKRHRHYSRDCPNIRLLLIKQNGEYISNFDNLEMKKFIENMTHGGDICEEKVIEPTNKEEDFNDFYCLVVRRTININMRDDFDNQRTNIFYSRCLIKGTLCSLIMDSGSCAYLVSSYLVDSLQLPCSKHSNPYHLQ
ncbi:hypothetical protein PVK06_034599 [Gossypium arboreum]|uniref:CCHC-type domain-containing protein n=1 Tax=Gossypium arboreum TaxID=29729 RepID=A0ABR0NEM6_GOSAR|nr:hypothetical protein PVK06_034599 [Gossypium arboreum]